MPPPDFPDPNAGTGAGVTPPAALDGLVEGLCGGLRPPDLLVASDFDGTLSPIVSTPGAARALPASISALERLAGLGVRVAVVSGRSLAALRRLVPVERALLLGDYGLDAPDASERAALRAFNERAAGELTGVEKVVLEPKPGSTSVHFRDNPAAGERVYAALAPLAERLGLRAGQGRMVVEVRPARADKGLALRRLLDELRPGAVAFAGDDEGDRPAFEAAAASGLRHLVVGVRSGEVSPDLFERCDAVIAGPEAWAGVLERIAARLG